MKAWRCSKFGTNIFSDCNPTLRILSQLEIRFKAHQTEQDFKKKDKYVSFQFKNGQFSPWAIEGTSAEQARLHLAPPTKTQKTWIKINNSGIRNEACHLRSNVNQKSRSQIGSLCRGANTSTFWRNLRGCRSAEAWTWHPPLSYPENCTKIIRIWKRAKPVYGTTSTAVLDLLGDHGEMFGLGSKPSAVKNGVLPQSRFTFSILVRGKKSFSGHWW